MAITYTVAQCEAEIVAIDAAIKDLRGLPNAGEIGDDRIEGIDNAYNRLKAERSVWASRLLAARNGNRYVGLRRVL